MKLTEPEILWMVIEDGFKHFRVTITDKTQIDDGQLVSVEGIVEAVTAWGGTGDAPDEPCEFEPYLTFGMKWDECCSVCFGEKGNDGYLHLCGADSWRRHNKLMSELFEWAKTTLPMK